MKRDSKSVREKKETANTTAMLAEADRAMRIFPDDGNAARGIESENANTNIHNITIGIRTAP